MKKGTAMAEYVPPKVWKWEQPNGGEFAKVAVALLNWQFKSDKEAGRMFLGPNCGLCQDSAWHVSKKGID